MFLNKNLGQGLNIFQVETQNHMISQLENIICLDFRKEIIIIYE